jgi:sugar phosphate isomerase/epimerase
MRVIDSLDEAPGSPALRFALELEPGPLFNIRNKESLLVFCDQIASIDEKYSAWIGLNLDIPHWCFLAGIDAAWVEKHLSVLRRIAHAHVSDHSSGHFCDAEPLLFHGACEFSPWLRLLSEVAKSNSGSELAMGYSGFVTCELECCPNEEFVRASVLHLQELASRYC